MDKSSRYDDALPKVLSFEKLCPMRISDEYRYGNCRYTDLLRSKTPLINISSMYLVVYLSWIEGM